MLFRNLRTITFKKKFPQLMREFNLIGFRFKPLENLY